MKSVQLADDDDLATVGTHWDELDGVLPTHDLRYAHRWLMPDVLAGTWTDTTHKDKGAPLTVSFSITTKQCVRMQGGCVLHAACTWLDVCCRRQV